jgi:hypothetical protein
VAEGFFKRNFVWYCTRDSIAAGKISVLACAETVLAIAFYGWVSWYFQTYAILITSLIAAPLVLLRSDKSVGLG